MFISEGVIVNSSSFKGSGALTPGLPPTEGLPPEPFQIYFSLMTDAYETTTLLSHFVDHCFS